MTVRCCHAYFIRHAQAWPSRRASATRLGLGRARMLRIQVWRSSCQKVPACLFGCAALGVPQRGQRFVAAADTGSTRSFQPVPDAASEL